MSVGMGVWGGCNSMYYARACDKHTHVNIQVEELSAEISEMREEMTAMTQQLQRQREAERARERERELERDLAARSAAYIYISDR